MRNAFNGRFVAFIKKSYVRDLQMKTYSGIEITILYFEEDAITMSGEESYDNTAEDIFPRRQD